MNKTTLFAFSIAYLLPCVAIAGSPNWNFVEVSYISSDLDMGGWDDFGGFEPDGFELAGSVGIGDWVFLDVRYSEESDEIDVYQYSVKLELDRLSAGIGLAWGITENTDLYGRLGYEDWSIKASASGYSDRADEDGATYAIGVRSVLWEVLELACEFEDIADETQYSLGAYYTFLPQFTVGASYVSVDDLETLKATFRFQF